MVEFVNMTGGKMYVDDSRVEEYKRLGFKPASFVSDKEEDKLPKPAKMKKKKED